MYRLREVKKKKYDFWGCWFRPLLIRLVRAIPSIVCVAFLTVVILTICYKYIATNEDSLIDYDYMSSIETNEVELVGNTYYKPQEKEITYPTKIIENIPLDAPFQNWLYGECERQGVDFYVVLSMMYHESRYNADSENVGSGCVGLMQLSTQYHQMYDYYGNAYDMKAPCLNAFKGISLVRAYVDRYGNYEQALEFYSGGSSAYATSVLEYAERLRNE